MVLSTEMGYQYMSSLTQWTIVSNSKIGNCDCFVFVNHTRIVLFALLENWVWKKIHLKFAKLWEMKKLPWDHEKGTGTMWHTVKPWELSGLLKVVLNTVLWTITFCLTLQ